MLVVLHLWINLMTHKIDVKKLVLDSIDQYYSTLSFAMECYLYQYFFPSLFLPNFSNFQALAIGGLFTCIPFSMLQHHLNHQLRHEHMSNYKILSINHLKFFTSIFELFCLSVIGGLVLSLNVTTLIQLNILAFCIHTAIRVAIDFASHYMNARSLSSNPESFTKNIFDQHLKLDSIHQQSSQLFECLFQQDWFDVVLFLLCNSIQITMFLIVGLFLIDINCSIYSALGIGFMNALLNSYIFFQLRYFISQLADDVNNNLKDIFTHLSNLFLLFSCIGMFGHSHALGVNIAMVVGGFVYNKLNNVFDLITKICQETLGEDVPRDYMPKFY
jgi:hypothetical protein